VISFKEKAGGDSTGYAHQRVDLMATGRYGNAPKVVSSLSQTIKDLPSNLIQLKVFLPAEFGDPITVCIINTHALQLSHINAWINGNRYE
jgi:hypothetical protein